MASVSQDKPSFGKYLQECRRKKNISLEFLSAELRIGTRILSAIENEDLPNLPDEVYTRGFLRSFAQMVGADTEWVIQDYQENVSLVQELHHSEMGGQAVNKFFWLKLAVAAVLMLTIMVMTVWHLSGGENKKKLPAPEKKASPAQTVSQKKIKTNVSPRKETDKGLPAPKNKEIIKLSIDTVEKTWIKIIIDNAETREYTLQPGDRIKLVASERFNLLIGNAAGVKLRANRIPIDVPGEQGEVVNIEIP